jgi:hypothetical protein
MTEAQARAALAIAVDALERISAVLGGVGQDPVAELRRRCAELSIPITAGAVDEAGTARLIGRSHLTLRNWRYAGDGRLSWQRRAGGVCYRVEDIAAYLERLECK